MKPSSSTPHPVGQRRPRAAAARRLAPFLTAMSLALGAVTAPAQWLTQSFSLKAGWNAVYLHVDATHTTLDALIGADVSNLIEEVWLWAPNPTTAQFITNPQAPSQPAHWMSWVRTQAPSATLTRLPGNAACLVRVAADYTWNLKGKPVVPRYQWSGSGLNFVGFATLPGKSTLSFDTFFTPAPELRVGAEIFAYRGGPITANPVQIFDQSATVVNRGEAFWIRATAFNRYFGPFEVAFTGSSGIQFGTALGQSSFRLRNTADRDVTITLSLAASEPPPAGQPAIAANPVPVLVRGDINPSTLTFSHSALASVPKQWLLKPRGQVGSEVEVVIGVDRQQLTGAPGQLYAGILRFRDSLNYTQVDVPVTAEVGSAAGLWVGEATVNSVSHFLKPYAKASSTAEMTTLLTRLGLGEGVDGYHYEIDPATTKVLVFGGPDNKTGSYLLDGPIKIDPGTVARPFPLRLIVHHDGSVAKLLQRVYYGTGLSAQPVLATRENLLDPAQLASARRISAIHLPFSAGNISWSLTGGMAAGSSLATTVEVSYDDQAANPFLHTYHPDHDNLDAAYRNAEPRGRESYGVRRLISLNFTAPANDFDSLTKGGSTRVGNYTEVVSFLGQGANPARQFDVRGTFVLTRLSDISTLSQ